jgi:hypothetical protein
MKKQVKKVATKKQVIAKPSTGALEKQSKEITDRLKNAIAGNTKTKNKYGFSESPVYVINVEPELADKLRDIAFGNLGAVGISDIFIYTKDLEDNDDEEIQDLYNEAIERQIDWMWVQE